MRTKELCHKLLSKTSIHQKRISVISETVETILESKELGVTQVGRKMNNHCQTRSNIRKVDRLYSNIHLPKEHEVISQCLSEWLIVNPKPLLVVDGSKISNSQWYLLRASLVAQGRAICIFEMIYTQRENASLRLYKRFLKQLNGILPSSCKPILITDAEFRGPWFKAVTALGWDYVGRLRGGVDAAYVRQLVDRLQLDTGLKIRAYSSGNRRKLGLVLALMSRPDLLIMDEPTGGLDPLMQQTFNELMLDVKAEGRTVFLSSHVLSEVQAICDRVGILRGGELKAVETVATLVHADFQWVTLRCREVLPAAVLAQVAGVSEVQTLPDGLRLRLAGDFDPLLRALAAYYVTEMVTEEPTLEEVFLTYYSGTSGKEATR